MMDSSGINPRRLKSFVRNACVILKKQKDKEKAGTDLKRQFLSMKRFSSRKKGIEDELKKLDEKMSDVLESELKISKIKSHEPHKGRLVEAVYDNKRKISQIKDSITRIEAQLGRFLDTKDKREKAIESLERRIRAKVGAKDTSVLKKKLNMMESAYGRLKKKGLSEQRIEDRISSLKARLEA
ncbi:hypothetical protein KY358_05150 [Candidatus Woesearchaeota archaeon]|nr:hypothetical protein [Candidatus Woesearchaeota archaeon]